MASLDQQDVEGVRVLRLSGSLTQPGVEASSPRSRRRCPDGRGRSSTSADVDLITTPGLDADHLDHQAAARHAGPGRVHRARRACSTCCAGAGSTKCWSSPAIATRPCSARRPELSPVACYNSLHVHPTSARRSEYDVIEPIGKRVVVRKDDNKRQTKSGIVLPDSHEIPVITGRVIAISKAIENDEDQTIRQYDKVLFDPREAIPVELEHDNRLFVVHIDRVLAIFRRSGRAESRGEGRWPNDGTRPASGDWTRNRTCDVDVRSYRRRGRTSPVRPSHPSTRIVPYAQESRPGRPLRPGQQLPPDPVSRAGRDVQVLRPTTTAS